MSKRATGLEPATFGLGSQDQRREGPRKFQDAARLPPGTPSAPPASELVMVGGSRGGTRKAASPDTTAPRFDQKLQGPEEVHFPARRACHRRRLTATAQACRWQSTTWGPRRRVVSAERVAPIAIAAVKLRRSTRLRSFVLRALGSRCFADRPTMLGAGANEVNLICPSARETFMVALQWKQHPNEDSTWSM